MYNYIIIYNEYNTMYDSCAEVIRSYGSMMFYVIVPIGKNGAGEVKISGSNQLATYCNVQDQNI